MKSMSSPGSYNITMIFSVIAKSMRAAWKFDKTAVILIAGLRGVTTLSTYAQLVFMGFIIDELVSVVQKGARPELLHKYIIAYSLALIIPMLLARWYAYVEAYFYRVFNDKLNIDFLESVATRDIQIIEDSNFQNFKSKAYEQGSWNVYDVVDHTITVFTRFASIVAALGYLGSMNWRFAALGAIAALPSLVVEYIHGKRVYGEWDDDTTERRIADDQKKQIQTKKDLVEIKLFGNVEWFLSRIREYMIAFQSKILKKDKQRVGDEFVGAIINGTAFAGALYLITLDALIGVITVGGITVALGAYSKLEGDLSEIFVSFGRVSKSVRYAGDYFAVRETKNILPVSSNMQILTLSAPSIEFQNVSFRYPGSDTWIFRNLNLRIRAGTKVALVGHNGAGKTTLVHLLLRIYDVTEGRVLVNGVDIRDVDIEQYYRNTAALMQEFATFKFPVRQAIALGDTSIPYDEYRMMEAARASHAYSFIERWNEGYNAMIGREFDGKELSGGERQRMAIARVFYRQAGLVILDEPTSAVDAIAEQEIFESVYNSPKEQTILTISHRFSTVKKSDIIMVLEYGKLVEMGNHGELVAKKGRYHELYSAQASAYSD